MKESFDTQGYVILKRLLSGEHVQQAREAMEQLVDNLAQQIVAEGVHADVRLATALFVPIAVLAIWWTVRRIRKRAAKE